MAEVVGREHDFAPDGSRADGARDFAGGPAIEVAAPHTDHQVAGVAHRPGVAIALAGACLDRCRKGQTEGRTQTEGRSPGGVVGKNVGDEGSHLRSEDSTILPLRSIGDHPCWTPNAAPCKSGIGVDQFLEGHLSCAQGEGQT